MSQVICSHSLMIGNYLGAILIFYLFLHDYLFIADLPGKFNNKICEMPL